MSQKKSSMKKRNLIVPQYLNTIVLRDGKMIQMEIMLVYSIIFFSSPEFQFQNCISFYIVSLDLDWHWWLWTFGMERMYSDVSKSQVPIHRTRLFPYKKYTCSWYNPQAWFRNDFGNELWRETHNKMFTRNYKKVQVCCNTVIYIRE